MGSRRNILILVLVLVLLGFSAWAIVTKDTKQGIDLAGGTELIYKGTGTPSNPTVEPEDMDQAIDIIRERVDVLGVSEPEIARIGSDQVSVALPDVQNAQDAIDQVGRTAQLFFYDFEKNVIPQDPSISDAKHRPYNRLWDAVDDASKRPPECATDEDGEKLCTTDGTFYLFDENTLEPIGQPALNRDDLFLQFPDDKQPANTIVKEVPQGTVVVQEEATPDDPGTETNETETSPRGWYVLKDEPGLTGKEIRNPEQNLDSFTNQPIVTFDFTDKGREQFQQVTEEIAQRGAAKPASVGVNNANDASQLSDSFAVVLDGKIESRPIINFFENPNGIDGRNGAQISGTFTISEAQDLAKILRIGALPINLQLISQSTVSATLGQQALDDAITAAIAGLALVILFLIAYYRFLGLVAALGLFVYACFYLAMIKLIPITMTLPGIAGLILTIGVAADSNIVIFERIKEEVRLGRSMLSAISQGYKKGIATIIDANVITLITAFILFVLATGGVKGFALTLGIGTIVSLFTAVLFTQAVLAVLGRAKFMRSPKFLGASEDEGYSWNFDFTGMSKYFFSFSGVILAIGAIAFATQQLNLGIDFESGTRIKAALDEPLPETDDDRTALQDHVRDALQSAGVGGMDGAEIQTASEEGFGETVVQIAGKIPPDDVAAVQTTLTDEFGLVGGEDGFDSNSIGPTFGEQIARSALIALVFSLIVISAYIALRFESKYAVPVLIALIHDILITGGIYALFSQEVSSATVAAFLTILGYSMYDTVIVFDRVRENVPRMPRAAFSQIVNRSMSEVLTRSLITGLSTVFLVSMLLVFGDETLRGFAFAMMVGIASGTYSSIFIAAPVLTEWKEREPQYRARRAYIQETMGYVPTFPEDNVVQRVEGHGEGDGEAEEVLISGGPPESGEVPADASDAAVPTGAPDTQPLPPEPKPSQPVMGAEDAGDGAPPKRASRAERQRKRQRSRRKHGRNR